MSQIRTLCVLMLAACVAILTGCPPVAPPSGGGPQSGGSGRLGETDGGIATGSGPHLEREGLVIVEAEHFTRTSADLLGQRAWYLQAGTQDGPGPDPDGYHGGASGDAYVECLPDTRVTHDDPMAPGSYYDGWGGATLEYDILFETPGTYYVWIRAFSSGTEDNGIHVGVNGVIPGSGQRWQRCGTGGWSWSSAQRDSGGTPCGVNGTISVTIPQAGLHTITLHQREDGFEIDRFILSNDPADVPNGAGPTESARQGG